MAPIDNIMIGKMAWKTENAILPSTVNPKIKRNTGYKVIFGME